MEAVVVYELVCGEPFSVVHHIFVRDVFTLCIDVMKRWRDLRIGSGIQDATCCAVPVCFLFFGRVFGVPHTNALARPTCLMPSGYSYKVILLFDGFVH